MIHLSKDIAIKDAQIKVDGHQRNLLKKSTV